MAFANHSCISRKTFKRRARSIFSSRTLDKLKKSSSFLDLPLDVIVNTCLWKVIVNKLEMFELFLPRQKRIFSLSLDGMSSSFEGSNSADDGGSSQFFFTGPEHFVFLFDKIRLLPDVVWHEHRGFRHKNINLLQRFRQGFAYKAVHNCSHCGV